MAISKLLRSLLKMESLKQIVESGRDGQVSNTIGFKYLIKKIILLTEVLLIF